MSINEEHAWHNTGLMILALL